MKGYLLSDYENIVPIYERVYTGIINLLYIISLNTFRPELRARTILNLISLDTLCAGAACYYEEVETIIPHDIIVVFRFYCSSTRYYRGVSLLIDIQ